MLRNLVKLFALGAVFEFIGLFGLVFLRLFVSQEVPIWTLLPHPAMSASRGENEFDIFDPNLGWYPSSYLFGKPRRELPPKQPGEVRAFLLGGSTAWGEGATREDETIAKRLEVYLGSDQARGLLGGTVRVYNEGVRGYYSKQELILLITKIIPFEQPDLVMVLDGVNDFIVYSTDRPHIDRLYSDMWHWQEVQLAQSIERVMSPVGAITNAGIWTTVAILRNTFFGNFLDQGLRVATPSKRGLMPRFFSVMRPVTSPPRAVSAQAINYYLENVTMMRSVCQGAKVNFFWFPQPALFLKKTKTPMEEALYNTSDSRYVSRNAQFWQDFDEFYGTAIGGDAVVRFGKAPFFQDISDSLTLFKGTAYADRFHYSPAAQDVIARRMAEAILNNLKD